MFNLFSKSFSLVSPVNGHTLSLAEVPDQVFSQKLVGEGLAIHPTHDLFVAPADGKINLIFHSNHAFAMELENGLELLIHIGMDTVELQGQGFERLVSENTFVQCGDPIIRIDQSFILGKGYSLISPIVITNFSKLKSYTALSAGNSVEAGKTLIMKYTL
jgi:PTS system glucose-specific IIA component